MTKQQVLSLKVSQLFGYGFTDDAVILGSDGLRQYLEENESKIYPTEGRFCGVFIYDEEIVIRSDATGQELLYLFQDEEDWMISNSFLLMAEHAAKRKRLNLHLPVVMGFNLKGGTHVGEQLISHRTMISEISVVPITCELHIDRRKGTLRIEREDFFSKFGFRDGSSYEDTLLGVLERGAGLLTALHDAGIPLNLNLSGGYDSRLVLCMLMAGGRKDHLRISSDVREAKADDFRAASALCNRLELPLNTGPPKLQPNLMGGDCVRMYLFSCGGTYLPFYPIRSYRLQTNAEVTLTGDQPTGWSHFAGSGQFNGDADKIANDILLALEDRGTGEIVKAEFLSTFDLLGVDRTHPAAMLAHYSAIRSRHHCGRNWYRSQGNTFLFTPLMQSSFVAMDLHNMENGHHPTKLFVDAFSAFGGWALEEPFETPDRTFEPELLANSSFKGGVRINPRSYEVYGQIGVNSQFNEPHIYSIAMDDITADRSTIKSALMTLFYRANRTRESGLFQPKDFAKAKEEIHQDASLSHGYRKLCHIVSTDMVLRIIEMSQQ